MQLANLGSDTPENTSSRFSDNDCNINNKKICSKFECKKALYIYVFLKSISLP
jgi:hypothetical protein